METLKEMHKRNLLVIKDNEKKVDALKRQKQTKLNRLAMYLLGGRPVTGRIMINRFHILSYRDAIYDLKQKGYEISAKTICENNGVSHVIWWLSCYDEKFALAREEKFFKFF